MNTIDILFALAIAVPLVCYVIGFILSHRKAKTDSEEKKTILLEIVSIGSTISTHIKKRIKPQELEKDLNFKINEKDVTIKPKDFFLKSLGFGTKIVNKLKGIKHSFIVFIEESQGVPFNFIAPEVAAKSLFVVKESTTLRRALSELFKTRLGNKALLFVAVIVVVAVVLGLLIYQKIQTGGVTW